MELVLNYLNRDLSDQRKNSTCKYTAVRVKKIQVDNQYPSYRLIIGKSPESNLDYHQT